MIRLNKVEACVDGKESPVCILIVGSAGGNGNGLRDLEWEPNTAAGELLVAELAVVDHVVVSLGASAVEVAGRGCAVGVGDDSVEVGGVSGGKGRDGARVHVELVVAIRAAKLEDDVALPDIVACRGGRADERIELVKNEREGMSADVCLGVTGAGRAAGAYKDDVADLSLARKDKVERRSDDGCRKSEERKVELHFERGGSR